MANREKTSLYQNNHYHMTNLEQMKNMMIMKIMTGRVEKRVNSPSSSWFINVAFHLQCFEMYWNPLSVIVYLGLWKLSLHKFMNISFTFFVLKITIKCIQIKSINVHVTYIILIIFLKSLLIRNRYLLIRTYLYIYYSFLMEDSKFVH